MKNPKKFVFLYPEKEIFNFEIERNSSRIYELWEKERGHLFDPFSENDAVKKRQIERAALKDLAKYFRPIYASKLNSCINHRYRKQGFQIVYAVSLQTSVIDVVDVRPEDMIIYTGEVREGHYPNPCKIVEGLLPLNVLRVGGFHMWDCVEKLARAAYKRGIDTLVDEDLTEFFGFRMFDRNFRVKTYTCCGPSKIFRREFFNSRRNKPWLWQDYKT